MQDERDRVDGAHQRPDWEEEALFLNAQLLSCSYQVKTSGFGLVSRSLRAEGKWESRAVGGISKLCGKVRFRTFLRSVEGVNHFVY